MLLLGDRRVGVLIAVDTRALAIPALITLSLFILAVRTQELNLTLVFWKQALLLQLVPLRQSRHGQPKDPFLSQQVKHELVDMDGFEIILNSHRDAPII